MRWDIFCRVIDNFGDIGVCWRLAAELGRRGETVQLWIDETAALAWMAPQGAPNVTVHRWAGDAAFGPPGDVVVEAFGCELPDAFVRTMAARAPAPSWINLEYLSAEPYVERSHGLRSPVLSGPGEGLVKWFFYPGFTSRTGGLIREPMATPSAAAPITPPLASVFCYDNPMLTQLQRRWPGALMLAPGAAQGLQGPGCWHLPWLSQDDYDRLLRQCEVNFVRGEDSVVRAMWAARPFVWQIYPQDDGAHRAKLEAFLDLFLAGQEQPFESDLRHLWRAWNGFADWPDRWPDARIWTENCHRWREKLLAQDDLATQLIRFAKDPLRQKQ